MWAYNKVFSIEFILIFCWILLDSNSLSVGALSQISSSNDDLKKIRNFNGTDHHNFRFEEPNFSKNISVSQDTHLKNGSRLTSDIENVDNSPVKVKFQMKIYELQFSKSISFQKYKRRLVYQLQPSYVTRNIEEKKN